jgi:uncharacterized protein
MLEKEFKLRKAQVESTVKLIDEGNTIPFIARYRKEVTGGIDDVTLRGLHERLTYLRNLESRKEAVLKTIDDQDKLTSEIITSIDKSQTLQEVEDIYAPFKQKKRTRATIAKEKGLEDLATAILTRSIPYIKVEAEKYIDEEKEVHDEEEALKGASDIIAEVVSDDAQVRKFIRNLALNSGTITSKNTKDEKSVYDMYYDYSELVKTLAPHRVLALNRGEKEDFLRVKLTIEDERALNFIEDRYIDQKNSKNRKILTEAIEDAYKRLIFPSIEREIRNYLTEKGEERAISVFGKNLKSLLMGAPIKEKAVMGFDPAYRTGCKIAVVDKNGKLLDYTTVYPTKPENKVKEAKSILKSMIEKYNIDLIAIGNGTASRESEEFVSDMLREIERNVEYVIVSEAGASVYSASELANEEHPDINVSIRGAISIARRLQDPLAELVKIDPKSIGVGQYQHDLNKKRLEEVLDGVVEDSVNSVGVDVNTASYSLLSHVAGVNKNIAKNIVAYREENGEFKSRSEIKKVKRLGPKVFEQSAGFMRVLDGKNPLDGTGVHPESYSACKELLSKIGYSLDDVKSKNISEIDNRIEEFGLDNLSRELETPSITLKDIISEIKKPGRDPREEGIKPILRKDVLKIEDIQRGMVLNGTVRNVVDFGAFIDIGIKNDGLVHKSKMGKGYVKDPMSVVSVGDVVEVSVLDIDLDKNKVSLSMVD